MKKLTESLPIIESLEHEVNVLSEQLWEAKEKLRQARINEVNLDFIGKFIKYSDPSDDVTDYMYVRDISKDIYMHPSHDLSYAIKGFGFCGEFTGFNDATWLNWDFEQEFYVYGDAKEFKEKVESIKVITPEEFEREFNNHVEAMKMHHNGLFNAIVSAKNEDLTIE